MVNCSPRRGLGKGGGVREFFSLFGLFGNVRPRSVGAGKLRTGPNTARSAHYIRLGAS